MTPVRLHIDRAPRRSVREWTTSILVCLAIGFASAPAAALDDPRASRPASSRVPVADRVLPSDQVLRAIESDGEDAIRGMVPRMFDRLRQIPLRPVRIGEQPRTPRDPETGAGLVVKLRF